MQQDTQVCRLQVRRCPSLSTCGSSSHLELSSSSCCCRVRWPATSHSASSELRTDCVALTLASPPSAPPSAPPLAHVSSSGASGTSSPQARALSLPLIHRDSLSSEVCIASLATPCTTASSPSSSVRRGSSGASLLSSTHLSCSSSSICSSSST